MAVSRSLRLQILRRDNHTCQSCGAKAPDVPLQIDHVVPVTLGGSDEPSNLRTLCEPCNSGKSATPPDAATVAKVSEDALRWSQAIKAAAENMLAAHGAQAAVYAQIERAWKASPNGRYRPLPAGWERSIDNFLAAGLPLPVLHDVVGIALSRERQDAWRYFCGVAWAKTRELQEAAKALLQVGDDPEDEYYDEDVDPKLAPGRESLAATILGTLAESTADLEARIARERIWLDDEDGPAPRSKLIIEAALTAVGEASRDVYALLGSVNDLLSLYPHDDVVEARREAEAKVIERVREPAGEIREALFATETVRVFILRQALAYLEAMPEEQMAEWMEYAVAWHGPASPWDETAELPGDKQVTYAAHVARVITSGRIFSHMCLGPGKHIKKCPTRAAFRVFFEDLACCEPSAPAEGHILHGFCSRHLEHVVEHGYDAPSGRHLTARDFEELEDA